MNIADETPLKIPTNTLPKGWRELGAKHFNISPNTVEKIVYGLRKNQEVFEHMLALAESEKLRKEADTREYQERIKAL